MKEIKTKPIIKDIKTLYYVVDISYKIKSAYIRTKGNVEQCNHNEIGNYVSNVTNNIGEHNLAFAWETGYIIGKYSKKFVQKIQKRCMDEDTALRSDTFDGNRTKQSSHTNIEKRTYGNTSPLGGQGTIRPNMDIIETKQKIQRKIRQFKMGDNIDSVKRKFVLDKVKQRYFRSKVTRMANQNNDYIGLQRTSILEHRLPNSISQSVERVIKQECYSSCEIDESIKQSAITGEKFMAHTSKRTIKTIQKSDEHKIQC